MTPVRWPEFTTLTELSSGGGRCGWGRGFYWPRGQSGNRWPESPPSGQTQWTGETWECPHTRHTLDYCRIMKHTHSYLLRIIHQAYASSMQSALMRLTSLLGAWAAETWGGGAPVQTGRSVTRRAESSSGLRTLTLDTHGHSGQSKAWTQTREGRVVIYQWHTQHKSTPC